MENGKKGKGECRRKNTEPIEKYHSAKSPIAEKVRFGALNLANDAGARAIKPVMKHPARLDIDGGSQ